MPESDGSAAGPGPFSLPGRSRTIVRGGWTVRWIGAPVTGRADILDARCRAIPRRLIVRKRAVRVPLQPVAAISVALKASSVRLRALSFFMTLRMCTFTVLSHMLSS